MKSARSKRIVLRGKRDEARVGGKNFLINIAISVWITLVENSLPGYENEAPTGKAFGGEGVVRAGVWDKGRGTSGAGETREPENREEQVQGPTR